METLQCELADGHTSLVLGGQPWTLLRGRCWRRMPASAVCDMSAWRLRGARRREMEKIVGTRQRSDPLNP